jgi:hypothetical protein
MRPGSGRLLLQSGDRTVVEVRSHQVSASAPADGEGAHQAVFPRLLDHAAEEGPSDGQRHFLNAVVGDRRFNLCGSHGKSVSHAHDHHYRQTLNFGKIGDVTFTHHADAVPCQAHEGYRLNCQQYEGLLQGSAGRCQICDFPAERMPQRKLYIDHGGAPGSWPVRGLLCIRCNSRLERGIPFNDAATAYLANAWYLRQLTAAGVPLEGRPEPDGVVVDNFGNHWHRRWAQLWTRLDNRGRPRTWRDLNHDFGPFNLTALK